MLANALRDLLAGLIDPSRILETGDWIPSEHEPRLHQYAVFRSLHEGTFGQMLRTPEAREKFRPYGDYTLVVESSRDALIGDRIGIEVPGSGDADNPGARARQAQPSAIRA